LASLKLLAGSEGGTTRSSTKKRWVRFHGRSDAASRSNIHAGLVPPETASVASSWQASAASIKVTMWPAHASAAAGAFWQV